MMDESLLPRRSFIIFDSYNEVKVALPYLKEDLGDYIKEIKPEVGGNILPHGGWTFWPRYIVMKNDKGDLYFESERYGGFSTVLGYKRRKYTTLFPLTPSELLEDHEWKNFYMRDDKYFDMSKAMKIYIALNL